MAGALRPVVVLMLLASILFVAAGVLDGVYPGGRSWDAGDPAGLSYVFAVINTLVAILVARGSERSLALRMGLSLFFVVERPLSAFTLGSKSTASIGVHLATALVELVILVSAVRVWRLGHSVPAGDLDELLSLDGASPSFDPPPAARPVAEEPDEEPVKQSRSGTLSGGSSWLIALTTLALAAVLVADGLVAGFTPAGREWGLSGESSGWLVYLFAVVALTVASRAVHGGRVAIRLLFATALLFFVERAFSPFALRVTDPVILGLHGLAAFVSLGVALSCASAIRGSRAAAPGEVPSLEAA